METCPFEVASLAACKLHYYTAGMAAVVRECLSLRSVSVSKNINT